MVRSTGHSSRGPDLVPRTTWSQLPVTPVPGIQCPLLDFTGTSVVYRHTCRENTQAHEKKSKTQRERKREGRAERENKNNYPELGAGNMPISPST